MQKGYTILSLSISVIVILIITLFCSCKSFEDKEVEKTIIKGQIINAKNKTVVLEQILATKIYEIKTIKTDKNGNFLIEQDSIKKTFYRLRIDENNIVHLFLNHGDTIIITAEYPIVPKTYTIEGSEDCILLREMNLRLIESTERLNELRNVFSVYIENPDINMDSLRIELMSISDSLYIGDRAYLSDFIKTNHTSPVIYAALHQYILTSPILSIENDFEIFEFALNSLEKYHPDLEQTKLLMSDFTKYKLHQQQILRDNVRLKPGDEAPDFILESIDNKTVKLSQFKGNFVLLHFWASWSNKSREDAKYLKKIYHKFKDKNLEIIQVSLDSDKTNWKNTIIKDGINEWTHVCDFKMWESSVTRVYGFNTIPLNFLIDKEGKIVAINVNLKEFEAEMTDIIGLNPYL